MGVDVQTPAGVIDGLQYARWSEEVFRQMRAGGVIAVHATICYHETFRETVGNIIAWNRLFERHPDLIFHGRTADDLDRARDTGRTAIFFGAQNPGCIGADIGLVEILHSLGLRFMQITYNMQSLLGAGCFEDEDTGLTRMGQAVVAEMNRLGMVVDLSHAGYRTMRDTIAASARPVAITHANPLAWHETPRNVPQDVLQALAERNGMLGLSLYPHHLKDGSDCSLQSFCDMAARMVDLMGPGGVGLGSDLCQDQPDSVVAWMRTGHWQKDGDTTARFPPMQDWFQTNADFPKIAKGLKAAGLSDEETAGVMGGNWARFWRDSFAPAGVRA